MRSSVTLSMLLFVLCNGVAVTMGRFLKTEVEDGKEDPPIPENLLLMKKSKLIANTSAGKVQVFYGSRVPERELQVGIASMELRSLLIHLYNAAATTIMFVRSGEAKLGFTYKDKLAQRRLKMGDVYQIPAGSVFYLVNMEADQKLRVLFSIGPSESFGDDAFQTFYIGGGAHSGLSGFKDEILQAAFNVSREELRKLFKHERGVIVPLEDSRATSTWTKFLQVKEEEKLQQIWEENEEVEKEDEESGDDDEEEQQTSWPWRKLLRSVLGEEIENTWEKITKTPPRSYNLFNRKPDFQNNYGSMVAVDGSRYRPLRSSGIGIYDVNLSAGSMMAPHVNPMATEYGMVVSGSGRIQVLYPNGTNAMDTTIKKGDVFFIPRYFPFCKVASKDEPLEIFGFTTSAQRNRPMVLVGATSVMKTMMGPELATAFGVREEDLKRIVGAQHEAVILPTP